MNDLSYEAIRNRYSRLKYCLTEMGRRLCTEKGLRIHAQRDENNYPLGIKVSDEEMAQLSLERAGFHGEWNYLIRSRV